MRNSTSLTIGTGRHFRILQRVLLTGGLALSSLVSARSEFEVKVEKKTPPPAVSESIRESLNPEALMLLDGETPVYEFWFRKEIPLKSTPESPEKALNSIRETTLLGVAVVHGALRDYKDNGMIVGACTIRFSLQPQDGDHLGSAEFPYFFTLVPAKHDAELEGITRYRQMVKASGKDTATGHPMVLSLRPVSGTDSGLPKLTEPAADHKCIRIQLTGKVLDSEKTVPILFDFVFSGRGHF